MSQHSLVECKVILQVKAELDACKVRDIQRTSSYKVWCPIHQLKNHALTDLQNLFEDHRIHDPNPLLSDPPTPR
jgi:hypothetical protein